MRWLKIRFIILLSNPIFTSIVFVICDFFPNKYCLNQQWVFTRFLGMQNFACNVIHLKFTECILLILLNIKTKMNLSFSLSNVCIIGKHTHSIFWCKIFTWGNPQTQVYTGIHSSSSVSITSGWYLLYRYLLV